MTIKRAQIWIETVIYTLIGLVIIGSLLYVVIPRINQLTDKTILLQSSEILKTINEKIDSVSLYPGSSREIELSLKKGEFIINSTGNTLSYVLSQTKYKYSEPNITLVNRNYVEFTEKGNNFYNVYLILNYSDINISYNSKQDTKKLTSASNTYTLLFENTGRMNNQTQINIRLID